MNVQSLSVRAHVLCKSLLHWCFVLSFAIAANEAPTGEHPFTITGRPEITDGDGLTFGPIEIRLHGIDAAETRQGRRTRNSATWPCDEAAVERLASLVGREPVTRELL